MALLLFVSTLICAGGWFFSSLTTKIILHFMETKGYPMPTREELKASSQEVTCRVFSFGAKNRR